MSKFSSVSSLLSSLEALSFSEVWAEMFEFGARCASQDSSADVVAVVCKLATSDSHYEKMLAAMAVRGAIMTSVKHGHPVDQAIQQHAEHLFLDPSSKISRLVADPVARTSSDATLHTLLTQASRAQFRHLTKILRALKKDDVLQRHFEITRKESLITKYNLLAEHVPLASVQQLTEDDQWGLPAHALARLSVLHADWMVGRLLEQLRAAGGADEEGDAGLPAALEANIHVTLRALCGGSQRHLDLGLQLLTAAYHRLSAPQHQRGPLLLGYWRRCPVAVSAYVLQNRTVVGGVQGRFTRHMWRSLAHKPQLIVDLSKAGFLRQARTNFSQVPAAARTLLFNECRELFTNHDGSVPVAVLRALPDAAVRMAEAERNFGLKALEENSAQRVPYLGLLPFPKARTLGHDFITHTDAELRQAAIEALVAGVRYHPAYLMDVLQFCAKRVKEQDPWRRCMFHALATLSPHRWLDEHCGQLDVLIRAALEAKDASPALLTAVEQLLVRMAEDHPDFVCKHLPTVVTRSGSLSGGADFLRSSSHAAVEHVLRALLPVLTRLVAEKKHSQFIQSLYFFEARQLRRLRTYVEPAVLQCVRSPDADVVYDALQLYLEYFPQEAGRHCALAMLEKEPDLICIDEVRRLVSREARASVLRPFVQPAEQLKGRFQRHIFGDSLHVLLFTESSFYRWSSATQRRYAETLLHAIMGCFKENMLEQRAAFQCFASLPDAPPLDGLLQMAGEHYESEFMRDWALISLGRMRDPKSLEELCRCLHDTRAREAITPLLHRLKDVPIRRALQLLAPALRSKLIAVQKDVVRFIGDEGSPAAYDELERFVADQGADVHPDVMVALLRAMWSFLDRPEVWRLYHTAARSTRPATCIAACAIPESRLTHKWQLEQLNELLLVLLSHPDNTVQVAAIECIERPQRLEDARVYPLLLAYINRLDEGYLASRAIRCLLQLKFPVDNTAERIMAVDEDTHLEQLTNLVMQSIRSRPAGRRGRLEQLATQLTTRLIEASRQPTTAVRLILLRHPQHWIPAFTTMQRHHLLHPGTLVAAVQGVDSGLPQQDNDQTLLANFEQEELRPHREAFFRRLGLALLVRTVQGRWTAESRAALAVYRDDADLWVRSDARLVRLPKSE